MTVRVLQHVVLRPAMEPESRVLYLSGSGDPVTGGGVQIAAGGTLSTATYFNALPASYWRRHTPVRSVVLHADVVGSGELVVHASDANGTVEELERLTWEDHDGELTAEVEIERFAGGGWLWFEVEASTEVELRSAAWRSTVDVPHEGGATVAMTTMNKPDYAIHTLASLGARPEVLEVIDLILVIDQGTDRVREHDGFAAVRDLLGDKLKLVEQANGGGSSGFSRGMIEALDRPGSTGALLLDDDVVLEPESVRRAVAFAALCDRPTIVGGHMLDLNRPTRLHSWAEQVDQDTFMWGPTIPESARFELVELTAAPPWAHRPARTDYNGWFMCMVPRSVIAEIGASVPMFIKWDDAEFGLRALAAGFPTVALPGVALWHLSWLDKIDTVDWQAYYHSRNRIVTALLHAERPRGGGLLRDSRRQHLKQLLSMEYYAVDVRNQALRDVLSGPDHLSDGLYDTLPHLRVRMAGYPETAVHPSDTPSAPARDRAPVPGPRGLPLLSLMARAVSRHLLLPGRHDPPHRFTAGEATWWRLPFVDGAQVTTPDGAGTRILRRRRAVFIRLWAESIRLHLLLWLRWAALAARYRRELARLTGPAAWRDRFRVHGNADVRTH